MILASVSRMTAIDHLMPFGGGAYMMAIKANGKVVLVSSTVSVKSSTTASSSRMGGQVEQNMFRFKMGLGSLLKAALVSALAGLTEAMGAGAGKLASFDSTAPDAAMAKNVAQSAPTPRST